jgi:hypothetical protein
MTKQSKTNPSTINWSSGGVKVLSKYVTVIQCSQICQINKAKAKAKAKMSSNNDDESILLVGMPAHTLVSKNQKVGAQKFTQDKAIHKDR